MAPGGTAAPHWCPARRPPVTSVTIRRRTPGCCGAESSMSGRRRTRRRKKQIKELVRKGIPHHFRAIVWQLLCNAQNMPIKEQYSELLKMTSPCEKLIRRDIARTYPEHDFFKEKDSLGQEVLFNVMKAYSLVDREVGYCQGSAFIVGLLLMQMPEEEAFCVFVKLMQDYRLRELFKPSMAELGLCMYQFECMIQEQLPELFVHFQAQKLSHLHVCILLVF
ncbi:ecotropic viral integration site 5 protein homolog [Dendropsophus ebraccatus]|uniref:ecotropic viral integration site 5 protein homolog n=1 Tax=Dendropsophus ebraccatus TaxID=150705 RepID=UPI0038321627